jgi:hypothetical protein
MPLPTADAQNRRPAAPRRAYAPPEVYRVSLQTSRRHLIFTYGNWPPNSSEPTTCTGHTHDSYYPADCTLP